jgi:hypothetical protein
VLRPHLELPAGNRRYYQRAVTRVRADSARLTPACSSPHSVALRPPVAGGFADERRIVVGDGRRVRTRKRYSVKWSGTSLCCPFS